MIAEAGQRARGWLAAGLGVESPFPWQQALLERFVDGRLPRAIDVPTGLGKTAIMAVLLAARAAGAAVPRRLVYVVDRRAVVDQATTVAEGLRALVARDSTLKSALGLPATSPLPISTLRGQRADNREWLADPAAPAIVVGTVDMVGSRLLFEGYGVSRRMRPFHAGLLGADTLLVLDEAHLTPAFEALLEGIAHERRSQHAGNPEPDVVPRFHLVSLSATGRAVGNTLTLGDQDLAHPVVRERLDARKRVVIREPLDVEVASLPIQLAREAWTSADEGRRAVRCIVFCDRRRDAQEAFAELGRLAGVGTKSEIEIGRELLVGARRVHERETTAAWLREHGFIGEARVPPTMPLFVVATSAGEVGVDLDADHMVGDVVAWERMVQRLGRVNRRGKGDASVIVVPTAPDKATREALAKAARASSARDDDGKSESLNEKEAALAGRQLRSEATLALLQRLPRSDGANDASPRALTKLKADAATDPDLAELVKRATSEAPLHPALNRPLIEAWSMTSLRDHAGRPEVQPWIRGWVDDEPQTRIVWRRWLPVPKREPVDDTETSAFFDAAAPHVIESLETSTADALAWLEKRVEAVAKRTEQQSGETGTPAHESGSASDDDEAEPLPVLRTSGIIAFALADNDEKTVAVTGRQVIGSKRERDRLAAMLRDSTLVVDARIGGLAEGLLDASSDTASDISDSTELLPFRVRLLTATSEQPADEATWREETTCTLDRDAEGQPRRWLSVETNVLRAPMTEEGRSVSQPQLLSEHEEWTERAARDLAMRLDLEPRYAKMLALAARIHDEGKASPRWQRAFAAPEDEELYGKTKSRPNLRILDGYRHELGSFLRAERDPRVADLEPELRELCLHLIVSHHGHARPVISTQSCDEAPPSVLERKAGEIALRFLRLQERWGPWGLAWWEALLRAADQRASRANDERRASRG